MLVKSFKDRNGVKVSLGDTVNHMAIGKGREGFVEATGRVERIVKLGYFIEVYTEGRTTPWYKMYLEKAPKAREITPEEVVKAYRDSGLRPGQGHFFHIAWDGAECACGLSVLHYIYTHQARAGERVRDVNDSRAVANWANLTYGVPYAMGFISGFDNSQPEPADAVYSLLMERGYQAGRKAWAAVVEAGLT